MPNSYKRQTLGHRQPDRQGTHTVGHCQPYIERAMTTRWRAGRLGTEGTDNQMDRGYTQCKTLGHWDTVNSTHVGHRQPALRHCLLYIWMAMATSQGEGKLGKEGTDNQTDRGHTQWGTLGHCQIYTEGTGDQSDRGHTHSVTH